MEILKKIGLTENEIKIYLDLLKSGSSTAYEISKRINIYRVHVYDKLEQLINKGLVTYIYKSSKKHFQATNPSKIKDHLEEKKKEIENQEKDVDKILPELNNMLKIKKEDTYVEIFKGIEGLKYFLKDIIKTEKEVLITGIDDKKYQDNLPLFMKQYFRDLKLKKIKERIITENKKNIFLFDKKLAPTTNYRYLKNNEFNPTNTFIYGNKVVLVTWGNPVTSVMIKNDLIAKTYKSHFEHLWKIASKKLI
ncbi:hypothetical protein HOK68_01950 [Candidatus Woesearchaeota archaeon]|jgi:sugar-specific transcriptional regulator TrmB|nr:hypothetical protein [Candidatus Woesearchaeota archaeon]MBT4387603.1 hypothetical protein [Candidatus Woesearchaeota archaeon]MBT4596035.1 hypothetical protein [Candidatus Woesearchaeota archaeon]MBT5740743.1 hypothetical protein [Candidatus Woesearchaeota archaeon]MBT6505521.1 hypothetical protein [Candidatus Woesearchaeota archaeon]